MLATVKILNQLFEEERISFCLLKTDVYELFDALIFLFKNVEDKII